jgi:hypothetical protein
MVDDITIIVAYLNIDPQKQLYQVQKVQQAELPISPPSGADSAGINKQIKK